MVRVFNMGIGFCLYVDRREAGRVARACAEAGAPAVEIGEAVEGEGVAWE
jgi:phosphoribosylaminoimidazole (AIR) synthetase